MVLARFWALTPEGGKRLQQKRRSARCGQRAQVLGDVSAYDHFAFSQKTDTPARFRLAGDFFGASARFFLVDSFFGAPAFFWLVDNFSTGR